MRSHPAVKVSQMVPGVSPEKCEQIVISRGNKEIAMRRKASEGGSYEPH